MKLFCIIFVLSIDPFGASILSWIPGLYVATSLCFHYSRGSKKAPQSTSTTSGPTNGIPEPMEEDLFYIVEADGKFRPASPMSRQSSTDLDFVDATEVMDNGAFVYIENDSTALVFDGMEVRELHFSELVPPKVDEAAKNITTHSPELATPLADDPLVDSQPDHFDSTSPSREPGETVHTTLDPSPVTSSTQAFSPAALSPSDFPDQLRPEVQEFLSRIRFSALGAGATTRMGGLRMMSIPPGAMLFSSLVARGLVFPQVGDQTSTAWMPSMTATRNSNQFDDSYYTRSNEDDALNNIGLEPMPVGASSPTSHPQAREPHLFYM